MSGKLIGNIFNECNHNICCEGPLNTVFVTLRFICLQANDGRWRHVVMVYDGHSLTLYVDNEVASTSVMPITGTLSHFLRNVDLCLPVLFRLMRREGIIFLPNQVKTKVPAPRCYLFHLI